MEEIKKQIVGTVLLILFLTNSATGTVRLPSLISDRMVLQRHTELKIWGWADPGEKVTVRFAGNHYYTEGSEAGKWMVHIPEQKAGGPYNMEINEIIIRDILIGDVWLCSGQSNMETPIARLVERYPDIPMSNQHMIRYFKVPTLNTVEKPQEDIAPHGKWFSGIASDIMNWTALAYFYAKESYEHNRVPIGMLVSSLGGSAIESWISQDHLKEFPHLQIDQVALDSLRIVSEDRGLGSWTREDWDDANWQQTSVPGMWKDNPQLASLRGVVYMRKTFEMPDQMAGRHARVFLGTLVDSDSVFVNGHFIGSTSYMYPPRKYDIPAGLLRAGRNVITVRLRSNSGYGGFITDKAYYVQGDDVRVNLAGQWKYRIGIDLDKAKPLVDRLANKRSAGSGLFNGMIYPIRDYQVAGAIWYQGESNSGQTQYYMTHLQNLIKSWRTLLNKPQLPFLLVQLPNYMEKQAQPSESGWAAIREAQAQVAQALPYTALAVTYDAGEWNDIHPLNKEVIAKRLLLGARKLLYQEQIVSSGPMYQSMKIEGDQIVLHFTEIGTGLRTRDGQSLKHFAIAGADKQFVWADAVIKGDKIIVRHADVQEPVAVRYAWSDNPEEANLINKEGLLASPFRTDNW
ncbi:MULTISPECIES: sialate O-acetylesterase [Sphingobacterium]|uniref:Sialate O-acetylesterase n=1 Tax=Sphingobacterium populi TaxID=1812824 RepID=A0ABW5UFL0_9SPHI|nr:sialate O-acetylesterase [Sphingobacterium sp. CFCC 11742]